MSVEANAAREVQVHRGSAMRSGQNVAKQLLEDELAPGLRSDDIIVR